MCRNIRIIQFGLFGAAVVILVCSVTLTSVQSVRSQDMPLSGILVAGEGWKQLSTDPHLPRTVTTGQGGKILFVAESSAKSPGGAYFLEAGTWTRIAASETLHSLVVDAEGNYLGVRGPGKLEPMLIRIEGMKTTVLQKSFPLAVQPFKRGPGFFLVTGKSTLEVHHGANININIKKFDLQEFSLSPTPTALSALALTPDGGTLYVGDAVSPYLWTFRLDPQGHLSAGERYAKVRTQAGASSETRALVVDRIGRVYAATAEGIQVFDPTGRLSGVLNSPERAPVTGVTLAGPGGDQLVILCNQKLYQRPLKFPGTKK